MPRKKTTSRRKKEMIVKDNPVENVQEKSFSSPEMSTGSKFITPKNIILLLVLLVIAGLWFFKGYFIAALVNGQPISRMQLNNQLQRKFGDQTLDNMINERLILGATQAKSIFIQTKDIDDRIKKIETQLDGKMTLSDALTQQGLTQDEFRRQIEIQLAIDKLFEKEASVAAKDIDDYIVKNKQAFATATDPAKLKTDVENILRQQKLNNLFEPWFNDIRKNAKIQKFL